ncbi:MAG TPA: carboxypeptidase-like regulatory domain-containing protein [Vicinamibacterales bacterium]|nr:carboxypeptidase-like regulatory domain-containing protein [Vicinamibacterales bacterium]
MIRSRTLVAWMTIGLVSLAAQAPQTEISGTVVMASAPQTPIGRVLVTISGPGIKSNRTVITDDQGRFVFAGLPSGAFTIVAARPPYVSTTFGAKRPGRPGTPITVAAGQRVTGVTIPLARGAAITGTLRNADGEVVRGAKVDVVPLDTQTSALTPPVVTDDRGIYRAFGLPPGRYLVAAGANDLPATGVVQFSDEQMDEILARLQRRSAGGATPASTPGSTTRPPQPRPEPAAPAPTYSYAPIYYPGTADPDQATTIALEDGEERAGVDITLQLVRTVAVAGHVSVAGGALPSSTQVTLNRLGVKGNQMIFTGPNTKSPDASGNFKFTGFLPGRYRVTARATSMTPAVYWALADLTLADADVSGIELTLQPGLRMSGRVVFDGGTPTSPIAPLRLVEVTGSTNVPPSGAARADGTFEILNIMPGTYTAIAPGYDSRWLLRSVVAGGRDILDLPLEIGPTGDVTGAVATFTDQHTELSGLLQSASNVAAPEYFVVVFSPDRNVWRLGARRVQFTRPSTDGRFSFRDLPAGDYLIAALTDMEPMDLGDASFLERLMPAAVAVHLNEGEKKTQDLKIAR